MLQVAEGLEVELDDGDVAVMQDSVLMVAKSSVFEQHNLSLEVLPSKGSIQPELPEKAVVLGPVVDLQPHGICFHNPVLLILPVFRGATTAWRSLDEAGINWKPLTDAKFLAGHAILSLDHFCRVVAGAREPEAAIKISCYMNASLDAKWVVSQVRCSYSKSLLDEYLQDEEILQGYQQCHPATFPAGRYPHGANLHLLWPGASEQLDPEPGPLIFSDFPFVSSVPWRAPDTAVDLDIKDQSRSRRRKFRCSDFKCFSGCIMAGLSTHRND